MCISNPREAQAMVEYLTTIDVGKTAIAHLDIPGGVEAASSIEITMTNRKLMPTAVVSAKGGGSTSAAGSKPMFYGMSIVSGEIAAQAANRQVSDCSSRWTSLPVGVRWRRVTRRPSTAGGTRAGARRRRQLQGPPEWGGDDRDTRVRRPLAGAGLDAALHAFKLKLARMDIDFADGNGIELMFIEMVRCTSEGCFMR